MSSGWLFSTEPNLYHSEGEFEELYYGDFEYIKKNCQFSKRDNKYSITITKLKNISG